MIVLMNKDNGLRTTDYGRLFNQHEFRHDFRRVYARAIASAGHPDVDSLWLYDDENDNVN